MSTDQTEAPDVDFVDTLIEAFPKIAQPFYRVAEFFNSPDLEDYVRDIADSVMGLGEFVVDSFTDAEEDAEPEAPAEPEPEATRPLTMQELLDLFLGKE